MKRQTSLMMLAGVLAVIGVSAVAFYAASLPTVLTVAVGPAGSDNYRLVTTLAQLLQREKASTRLRIVTTEGPGDSANALQSRRADLAVVRSDVDMPADGLLLAPLRRDVLAILVPAGAPIAAPADLKDKRIGIVYGASVNRPLLRRILGYYGVQPGDDELLALTPEEAGPALQDGRVQALFTVTPAAGNLLPDLYDSVAKALGAPPNFLKIAEAKAIAQRTPTLEASEIVRGMLGGAPPRPADNVTTLSVMHRLVVHRRVNDSSVTTFSQLLFALRPALIKEIPIAAQIEAPDIDRGAELPVHPGALDYFEGDIKTFIDRYSDWFYLIVMLVGIGGSGVAGLASIAQKSGRGQQRHELRSLVALLADTRHAEAADILDALETKLDTLFALTLERISANDLDASQIAAFTLALDQARRAIAERRLGLAHAPRAHLMPAAAE